MPATTRSLLTALSLVLLLMSAACMGGLPAGGGGAAKAATAQATDPSGLQVVAWDKAMDYVGQEVVVEGTVVDVKETRNNIFVNFHVDFRSTFSIFVPTNSKETVKAGLPGFPESVRGKKVRIKGRVERYEKDGQVKPEIKLTDPAQLTIL